MPVQLSGDSGQVTPGSAVLEALLTGLLLDVCLGLTIFEGAMPFALAALALGIFVWRSLKLYRSGVMPVGMQCVLMLVPPAIPCLGILFILSQMKLTFM
jgi:hypothetical protein